MQRIDLIPSDLKIYPFLDTRKVFGSTISLTLVVLLSIYIFQLSAIEKYRVLVQRQRIEKNSLLKEKKEFEKILSQSEEIKKENQKLGEKIGVIQNIMSDRVFWSSILKEVTHMVPKGCWLEKLEVSEKNVKKEEDENQVKKKIVFEGISLNNEKAFEFLTNLESSLFFESLVLVFSQKDKIGERTVYHFQIEGEVIR